MQNKLLLLEDVDGLGRKGDLVNARPGYVRNFLLPQGLVVIADANTIRMQARLKEERQKQAVVDKKESEELASKLEGINLSITVKVDHEGHMYGSVSALDIVHLLNEQANVAVEKRFVQLTHPIKETGVHNIKFKLKEGITSACTLKIVPDQEETVMSKDKKDKKDKEDQQG